MFPYTSQSSTTSFATRTFQTGGQSLGWISGRSCRKRCHCSGDGGGCRCKSSCRQTGPASSRRSWASPAPSQLASFDDTAWSGEVGRRGGRASYPTQRYAGGGGWRRSPYGAPRPYGGGSRGWGQQRSWRGRPWGGGQSWGAGRSWGSRRSWASGGTWGRGRYGGGHGSSWNRRGWGSQAGAPGYGGGAGGWPGSPGDVGSVLRSNGLWARRLGWGRYSPLIAQAIGSPSASPFSASFARSVARWQRRAGMPPTGVLTPRTWMSLHAMMAGAPPPEPAAPPPPSAEPPIGDAPPAAPEPAAAAPDDGAGDAGGADAAPPADPGAPAGDAAGEWYELARWANP